MGGHQKISEEIIRRHRVKLCPIIRDNNSFLETKGTSARLYVPSPYGGLVLFSLLTLLFLGYSFYELREYLETKSLLASTQQTQGRVTRIEAPKEACEDKSQEKFIVTYSYSVRGIEYTKVDSEISPPKAASLKAGSVVPVVYNPDNTSQARLGTPTNFWNPRQRDPDGAGMLIYGACLAGLGVAMWFCLRNLTSARKLNSQGQIVSAEVISASAEKDDDDGYTLTKVFYRLTINDETVVGKAEYRDRSGAVRVPKTGESIPVLACDKSLHRPL